LDKTRRYFQEENIAYIQTRLEDWNDFHVTKVKNLFGYDDDMTTDNYDADSNNIDDESSDDTDEQTQSSSTTQSKKKMIQNTPNMILVDVVIIETEEVKSNSKGINLLEGLQVTLGGTISYNYSSSGDVYDDSGWTVSPEFTFSGLTYIFNIFNDGANKAEILASPSLLAVEGSTSSFHSGSTLHVALDSANGDASLEDVDVGINLQITPTFYENELIKIKVHAQRSQLEPLFEDVGFKSAAQTSKTSVDATAVLKIGDTLILSGLTQAYKNRSESGVPVLQDVPIVQYLFSKENESDLKKSIMILLTPQ
jgi:type II secretory pathway component GspD/PulD (secretin)